MALKKNQSGKDARVIVRTMNGYVPPPRREKG
jgi:hypothetical protein